MQLEVGCSQNTSQTTVTTSSCPVGVLCLAFFHLHCCDGATWLRRWLWHSQKEWRFIRTAVIRTAVQGHSASSSPCHCGASNKSCSCRLDEVDSRRGNRENDRFSWKCTAFSDRQARRSKEHHATSKIFITRQHLTCCWYVFSVFIDIQARLPGHGLLGWRPPLWKRDGRYQGTVSLREGKHIQNQPKNPEPVWKLVKFPEGMVAQASQRRRLSRTRLRSELSRCGAGANAPNGKQFWRIQELDFESFDVQTCSKQHFTVTVAGRHGLCTVSEPEAFHGTRGPKKAILKLTFLGTLPRTNGQRTLHIARSQRYLNSTNMEMPPLERWLADKADSLQKLLIMTFLTASIAPAVSSPVSQRSTNARIAWVQSGVWTITSTFHPHTTAPFSSSSSKSNPFEDVNWAILHVSTSSKLR